MWIGYHSTGQKWSRPAVSGFEQQNMWIGYFWTSNEQKRKEAESDAVVHKRKALVTTRTVSWHFNIELILVMGSIIPPLGCPRPQRGGREKVADINPVLATRVVVCSGIFCRSLLVIRVLCRCAPPSRLLPVTMHWLVVFPVHRFA